MQFMLMCCFEEDRWRNLPESQRQAIMAEYAKFEQEEVSGGRHIATAQLQPVSTAITVREKNGKRVATDGPFAETKEQLGGIHLIECKDVEEAIAIAGRIPTLPAGGTIEIRPVLRLSAE